MGADGARQAINFTRDRSSRGEEFLTTSNFDSATWTHIIITVKDTTYKVYKNGDLVGTKTDGHEPNVLFRTNHFIGATDWGGMGHYFDGTIGYLKMWHGVEVRKKTS